MKATRESIKLADVQLKDKTPLYIKKNFFANYFYAI